MCYIGNPYTDFYPCSTFRTLARINRVWLLRILVLDLLAIPGYLCQVNTWHLIEVTFGCLKKLLMKELTTHSQSREMACYDRILINLLWESGVFPKWSRNSLNIGNSENLINHWSMKWVHFQDPVFNMYLAGTLVASWSLTQDAAGWQVQVLLL